MSAHSLGLLLAELPPRVHGLVDTSVFARLRSAECLAVERLAEATGSHVVAYDLRAVGERLPLCATVAQADLDREQIAAFRAAEQAIAPWVALVAYARPAELRVPEEVLLRASVGRRPALRHAGASARTGAPDRLPSGATKGPDDSL